MKDLSGTPDNFTKNIKTIVDFHTKYKPKSQSKMKKFSVTTTKEIPLDHLQSIIITAVEGGSNYWYLFDEVGTKQISKYKGKYILEIHGKNKEFFYGTLTEAILPAIMEGEEIEIYDAETAYDDEMEQIGVLSFDSIQMGIDKMIKDNRKEVEILFDEEMDYDIWDADVIFQYFCLGEIVYG